jgi:hypothetical protein
MSKGRPNRQYNTAKRETEEAEMIDSMQDNPDNVERDESELDVCDLMGTTMHDDEEWE